MATAKHQDPEMKMVEPEFSQAGEGIERALRAHAGSEALALTHANTSFIRNQASKNTQRDPDVFVS